MQSKDPWMLTRLLAGAFPPPVAVAVGVMGVLTLAGALYAVVSPGAVRPEMWVLARGWAVWSVFSSLYAWSDKKLMSVADWPLLRLTGQNANLYRGLTLPSALRATLAHWASAPIALIVAPQFGGFLATVWLEFLSWVLGAALGFSFLQMRIWVRAYPKVVQYLSLGLGLAWLASLFLGYTPMGWLSLGFRMTAAGLASGIAFPLFAAVVAAAGYFFAEWRFRYADERAAHVAAVAFSAPGTAVAPKPEKPRVRPSKRIRGRRPVTEFVVRTIRPGFRWAAAAGLAVVLLTGFALPPAAEALGRPGVDVLVPTLGIAAGLAISAYAFCAALTASMIAEMGLRERWLPDILLATEAKSGLRQLTRGCFTALMPLVWFGLACGGIYAAVSQDWRTVGIWATLYVGVAVLGFLSNLAAVSLTLKHPGKGWSQLWRMGVGFLVLPLALLYAPFHYRKTERLVEAEPGKLEVVK